VPFSPLGRGFLTGKINANTNFDANDFRNTLPRFSKENMIANQELVDLLAKIADKLGSSISQISLAWILSQKSWIVPIPGTTKLERLEENINSTNIVLDTTILEEINTALNKISILGNRYPEQLQKTVNR
jgi:aryl-alcohol dehydrogenase-like predicted oxidoreductase